MENHRKRLIVDTLTINKQNVVEKIKIDDLITTIVIFSSSLNVTENNRDYNQE